MDKYRLVGIIALAMSLGAYLQPPRALAAEKNVIHMGSFSKTVDYAPYLVAKQKHWIEMGLRPGTSMSNTTPFRRCPL